jgi:hypothetical protein
MGYLIILVLARGPSFFLVLLLVAAGGLWGWLRGVHNLRCTRVNGLIFDVAGKSIKTLYGLRSIEAQGLLEEFSVWGSMFIAIQECQ